MINFNEEQHKYTNDSGREYISVTTLIGKYKNKFDSEKEAIKCEIRGKQNPDYKYAGMTYKEILNLWDDICDTALIKGNKYHNLKEIEVLYQGQVLNHPLKNGTTTLFKGYQEYIDLSKLECGIEYPELRIYLDRLKLAGHVDYTYIDYQGYVHIKDYKTNKKPITKESYKNKKMLYPLDKINDSSYYHYALQMNIYAWMLEQYGYKIGTLEILHKPFLDDEPIPEEYKTPFVSEEEQRKLKVIPINYKKKIMDMFMLHREKTLNHG